ncbi:aspartate aminotransferase family protein [Paremcibacter congregatus]|uniref:aspartate aminotransferase family protein n=1 Tax=Paremcibacter congregatus TaxID=2043170 RepID=UPI003A8E5EE4
MKNFTKSASLFERAKKVLPGGVSRNTLLRGDNPLYASRGKGCMVLDVDGIERIDFANNMASHIHGHAFKPIVEAVSEQMSRGMAFTMATEAELKFAEHMCGRSPSIDKIRFVNSGTEAVMAGMKASRAYTGRSKIAKVEGSYHGAYDYAEVSQAPTPENWGDINRPKAVPLAHGTPGGVVNDMVIIPFNDPEQAISILDEYKDQIACVLIDPIPHRIGMIPVKVEFVKALRGWTQNNGALLMFDEVITFRSEIGGMQARFDVKPDLTSMGKMIGGGFPVGALAGSHEVMEVFVNGSLPHSGTFSANPITMTAGRVAMELFDAQAVTRLNTLGNYARANIAEAIKLADVPACVTGTGSLFRIHLKDKVPRNYRESHSSSTGKRALAAFVDALYDDGIMMIHTAAAALSTPMGNGEIDRLSEAVLKSLSSIKGLVEEPK